MAAPQFGRTTYGWAKRGIIKFGGMSVPVVGGTMSYIDLNDAVYYYAQDIDISGTHIKNTAMQKTWLASGVWLSQDFVGRTVRIPMKYDETGNGGSAQSIAQAMGQLSQAGEQYLTFDNATGLRCRFDGWSKRNVLFEDNNGYGWDTELIFQSRNPFFEDLAATTQSVGAVSGGIGGTDNNYTISYVGAAFCAPVYTITVPVGNTQAITSMAMKNITSGETLSATTPVPANQAHTVVFDSGLMTVTIDGVQQVFTGSFPMLYPAIPPPQSNSMRLTITAAGATTGITLSVSFTPLWEG
jgi:hypothetical protein